MVVPNCLTAVVSGQKLGIMKGFVTPCISINKTTTITHILWFGEMLFCALFIIKNRTSLKWVVNRNPVETSLNINAGCVHSSKAMWEMKKKTLTTTLKPVIVGLCLVFFSWMDLGSYKQMFTFRNYFFFGWLSAKPRQGLFFKYFYVWRLK